jgi:hypothetical protein
MADALLGLVAHPLAVVTHVLHGPRRRERATCPPQVQRARMPVADRLLAYRGFVDRIERQRNLDQFLSNWSGHFDASG